MKQIIVDEKSEGLRADKFLQNALADFSRTDIQKLLAAGSVLFDGKPISKSFRVEEGMIFELLGLPEKEASTLEPEYVPLDIVYEDEDIVVINKPRNLVVHPGNGVKGGTLAAGLLYHFKENLSTVNGPLRPGIVHRLDKDTPGLMIVAKNDAAHRHLAHQLETRTLSRTYQALIWGTPRDQEGVIDAPIGRDPKNRLKQAVTKKDGKDARTHYTALEYFTFATLMEYKLETGRTHQIRVHSRFMGSPIFGDPLYDGRDVCLVRVQPLVRNIAEQALEIAPAQLLQAVKIRLIHPRTEEEMEFEVPREQSFEQVLELLREHVPEEAPVFEDDGFRAFDADMRFENEDDIEEEEYFEDLYPDYEEKPVKERLTRAERFAMKKERIRKKKALMLELRKKEAEKRGEDPDKVVPAGYEPTIDPNLL